MLNQMHRRTNARAGDMSFFDGVREMDATQVARILAFQRKTHRKTCAWRGDEFEGLGNAKYCKPYHTWLASREKHKEARNAHRRERYAMQQS